MFKSLCFIFSFISFSLCAQVEFSLRTGKSVETIRVIAIKNCKTGEKIRLEETSGSIYNLSIERFECAESIECYFETDKCIYSCVIPISQLKNPGKYEGYLVGHKRTRNLILSDRSMAVQTPYLLKRIRKFSGFWNN